MPERRAPAPDTGRRAELAARLVRERGLSQREAARKCGVSHTTVRRALDPERLRAADAKQRERPERREAMRRYRREAYARERERRDWVADFRCEVAGRTLLVGVAPDLIVAATDPGGAWYRPARALVLDCPCGGRHMLYGLQWRHPRSGERAEAVAAGLSDGR